MHDQGFSPVIEGRAKGVCANDGVRNVILPLCQCVTREKDPG